MIQNSSDSCSRSHGSSTMIMCQQQQHHQSASQRPAAEAEQKRPRSRVVLVNDSHREPLQASKNPTKSGLAAVGVKDP
ncbi:hypothetical protein ANO14919_084790 [Xylariales sp. No.14919]|nr:hypothetical protein ANO14919_084790 [Xylariales sp. No.14919]